MKNLIARVRTFVTQEDGATMVEYGLMVALIAVVCITGVQLLGGSIADIFDRITDAFSSAE